MDAPGPATILLIEHDPARARAIESALRGYRLWHAETGADARAILKQRTPDVILLDLVLPDVDGLVLCTWLRSEAPDLPIVACAESGTRERVLCLELGVEDVLRRPLDLAELRARVDAVLRRRHARHDRPGPIQQEHYLGSLVVDSARWRVTVDGRRVDLTPTEFQLLAFLAQRAGQVISREELAREVWGDASMARSRTIDAYARRVRRKLSGHGAPRVLGVHGFGYLLAAPLVTAAKQPPIITAA